MFFGPPSFLAEFALPSQLSIGSGFQLGPQFKFLSEFVLINAILSLVQLLEIEVDTYRDRDGCTCSEQMSAALLL